MNQQERPRLLTPIEQRVVEITGYLMPDGIQEVKMSFPVNVKSGAPDGEAYGTTIGILRQNGGLIVDGDDQKSVVYYPFENLQNLKLTARKVVLAAESANPA